MHNSVNKNLRQLQLKKLEISSNVNEVISAVLNSLFFFLQKDFTRTKSTKSTKTPRQKHKNATKRISDIFPHICFLSSYLFVVGGLCFVLVKFFNKEV